MAGSEARTATAAGVVEQFPTAAFARPHRLAHDDIAALATSLLELSSGYETALRTVISMQRNLERVRGRSEVSPEAALLLQEIARQLQTLVDGGGGLAERLRGAARTLDSVRAARDV